jgi:hypothetical protein
MGLSPVPDRQGSASGRRRHLCLRRPPRSDAEKATFSAIVCSHWTTVRSRASLFTTLSPSTLTRYCSVLQLVATTTAAATAAAATTATAAAAATAAALALFGFAHAKLPAIER